MCALSVWVQAPLFRAAALAAARAEQEELEATSSFGRFTFMEDIVVSEGSRKTSKPVATAIVKPVRQLGSTLVVAAQVALHGGRIA